MKLDPPSIDGDLDALMEQVRGIPPLPDNTRARALSRARSAMAMTKAMAPGWNVPERSGPARRRLLTLALAASLVLLIGAAGAIAALLGVRALHPQPASPAPVAPRLSPAASVTVPVIDDTSLAPSSATEDRSQPLQNPAAARKLYAAELALLGRAQSWFGRHDFGRALALVAEHTRRFPNGRLAEEREALRVRALAGAGRTDEARRAASSFAERFPRSVLLPRLGSQPR